jgi:hypothetical protein
MIGSFLSTADHCLRSRRSERESHNSRRFRDKWVTQMGQMSYVCTTTIPKHTLFVEHDNIDLTITINISARKN